MTPMILLPGVQLGFYRGSDFIVTDLEGLFDSPEPDLDPQKRENGHGNYGQADVWQQARRIRVRGNYAGPDQFGASDLLKKLVGEHFEATFVMPNGTFRSEVTFGSRVSWRRVGDWSAHFEFSLLADDPRLYGPLQSLSTGVPSPGVGLADPILDPLQVGEVVEVARNLFTNPRFRGDGTWAEVARFPTGSTPPAFAQPEDFRVRDLGTGESVMEIERVAGLAASDCIAGVSTWEGRPAIRLIPTHGTGSRVSLTMPPGDVRNGGVALGTLHLKAPITGTLEALAGKIVSTNPVAQTGTFVNAAGSYPLRLSYGARTNAYGVQWRHGGAQGSGDVWWTDIGLYAGEYAGEAFNGSTPGDGTRMYMWAGAPDNSESLAVEVDASDQGNPGRVAFTNLGTAPSEPVVKVYGGMSGGFELLCVETGRIVRCTRPIPEGSFVRVDHGTGELWIDDQSPLPSTYVPVGEWFQVPPGGTCTIQWTPIGVVTGTPQMVVEAAEASW